MPDVIVVALLSLAGTLLGSLAGILTANRLVLYRIAQLEAKVERHNTLVERMIKVEGSLALAHRRLDLLAPR